MNFDWSLRRPKKPDPDRCKKQAERIHELEESITKLNRDLDNANRELEFLREQIKPYVEYSCDYSPTDFFGTRSRKIYKVVDTLQASQALVAKLNLRIAVLEHALGPTRTRSCEETYCALVKLKCEKTNQEADKPS